MSFEKEFSKNDVIINKFEGTLIDKSLINTRKDFDYIVPSYQNMIEDMRIWIKQHESFYKCYNL